jgi:murein DD-endopeptidase MepM/ murein hydrolase activator NlpD
MRDARRALRVFWPLIGGFAAGSAATFAWPGGAAVPSVDAAQLEAWQQEIDRQVALVGETRSRLAATTDVVESRLSEMHARLLALDVATTVLVSRSGIDAEALWRDRAGAPDVTEMPGDLAKMLELASAELTMREQELAVLAELLPRYDVEPQGLPVPAGRITSLYGQREDPFTGVAAHHAGIDIAARAGTPVIAVASGLVTWSGSRIGYGETIDLEHGNSLMTRYAHNAENLVDVGDYVRRGQIIARLGGSGRTTGPNLHFEVRRHEQAVDPLEYVDQAR